MKFFIKKFSTIILIISFLLLIYTFYKSEIILDGSNRSYYKIYYLISLILIFFSIITFFINDKTKQYLIISGISLIFSLYLFEGYLTFKEPFSKEQILTKKLYEKQTGNKWDRRKKLDIYKELKKNDNEVAVVFHPIKLVISNYSNVPFPLSGLSNSKIIHCNENGYYAIFQSDRYGFNNPDNEWDKKEIEYLLIGDSFAHGACVNRPNDIGSVLRNLSKKNVLNLGIGGNGPLIEYATLREYLDKNVKKVLWIYYEGNDLADLQNERENKILINYLKDLNFTQNLKFKQNDVDSFVLNLIQENVENASKLDKVKIIKFFKIYHTRVSILHPPPPPKPAEPPPAPEFKQILQLSKELVNKNNSKLYFIYLPAWSRYSKTYDFKNYDLVKNIVTELKIPFIDLHKEVFEKEQNPLKLFPFEHRHYTVDGYKKVTETIYKFTQD